MKEVTSFPHPAEAVIIRSALQESFQIGADAVLKVNIHG